MMKFHTLFGAIAATLLATMTAGIVAVDMADARDAAGLYAASPLHDWFMGRRNQLGEVCCDEVDGRPTDSWGTDAKGFTITVDGKTFEVPKEAVVLGPNKLGRAIVWTFPPAKVTASDMIRCFMPGTMG